MTKKQSEGFEFRAKTVGQEDYIRCIVENIVTFVDGPAGTGKTYCGIGLACECLKHNKIDRILVSRSIIGCDEQNLGALKGSLVEKIAPYVSAYEEYFNLFL